MRGRVFTNQRVTATHTVCRQPFVFSRFFWAVKLNKKKVKFQKTLVTRLTSAQYLRWPCLKSGLSGGGGGGGRGTHETTLALHSIACIEFCAEYGNMILIRHCIVNGRGYLLSRRLNQSNTPTQWIAVSHDLAQSNAFETFKLIY